MAQDSGPVSGERAWIVTWNPDKFSWQDGFPEAVQKTARGESVRDSWSAGNRTSGVHRGDSVFLLRLGAQGYRGIIGRGTSRGGVTPGPHWDKSGQVINYIDLDWECVVPLADVLAVAVLEHELPEQHWHPQASGISVKPELIDALERLWSVHLRSIGRNDRSVGLRVPPKRSPPWVRDEVILACDLVAQNDWQYLDAEHPQVIELSALLQRLPLHPMDVRSDTFRNFNSVARKTADIATHHPDYTGAKTKGGAIDEEVLQEFLDDPVGMHEIAETLRHAITNDAVVEQLLAPIDDEDDEAKEGRLLQRQHFVRERDKKLRAKKIAAFLKTHPRVHCEVCGFDFEAVYGERGHEYTEVHHVVPLHASGETKTKLTDLVLLCANCHRMIHRYSPWLIPDELRGLLADQIPAGRRTED